MKRSHRSAPRTITKAPSPRWLSNTLVLAGALGVAGCGSDFGGDSADSGGREGGCGVGVSREALTTPSGGLSPAVLSDIRMYLDFSNSTYDQDPSLQNEMRRGIDLGMRLWQSVLPALRYRWVESRAQANLPLVFANYQSEAARDATNCPGATVFLACAVLPVSNALPANAAIWFNDGGKPIGPGHYPPFAFDRYTFASRERLFSSYIPATYPPVGYQRNVSAGNTVGHYDELELGGSEDIAGIFFHEFAHVLGMGHYNLTVEALVDWYGTPRSWQGATPPQPAQHISESLYPGLPAHYYTSAGYYGGGSYNEATGQIVEQWFGDLDEMAPLMFNHHHGLTWYENPALAGIPMPPGAKFNNRVVFPGDIASEQLPDYDWSYPKSRGLIVLMQPATGHYFLTTDWSAAITKAQLDNRGQTNGWFVYDVVIDPALHAKVSTGNGHTLAVRSDGSVWSWGRNDYGQLGTGGASQTPTLRPTRISSLTGTFVAVSAGLEHSVALKSDGTIW
ncbi:MAG TPA: hypothetical protein VFZ53_26280, partial [Polyangiaceae bacterium]